MTEVEEKNGKECKEQETGNRDSTARTHIERAANALKAQGMYRTNGHTNPGNDHTTRQYIRHFHAKRGIWRLTGAAVVASGTLETVQAALP